MTVEVILNQDSMLDFPKYQEYLEYLPSKISLLDFSEHFYFQNGHVMTSVANKLQGCSQASHIV